MTGEETEDLLRAKAEMLIADQGVADRCRFLKGTGDRIPLEDGAVDFHYARLLFQHLPHPLEVLGEMCRITRRGGIAVVLDDDRSNIVHPAPAELSPLKELIRMPTTFAIHNIFSTAIQCS